MSCGVGGRGCLETVPSPAQPSPAPSTTSWLHLHSCRPGLHWSLLHARTALVPTEGLPQNTDIIQTNFVFMLCMDNITIRESLLTNYFLRLQSQSDEIYN